MAETDWTALTGELNLASLDRGVTTGIAKPSGGGSFIFGFNSLTTAQGAAAYFTNQAGFAPTAALKGGSVRGAVQRGISGGDINFAPFLFICLQGPDVTDLGYLLGLQDDEPHRIALRKGSIVTGLPSASPGASGILKRSTATFTKGTWLHLRLDAVVNINGDVILKVFRNDLGANPVTSPVWVAEPGLEDFTDDALGVNSGSAPYTSGRMGFGHYVNDVSRRGYFDQLECFRQT